MSLKDLSNDIKAALFSRLSSPLGGTFLISWVLWNIDAVLVIAFENTPMSHRIIYVNQVFLEDKLSTWGYPFISAMVWIIAYPWLSRLVFEHWERQRVEKERQRLKMSGNTPISAETHAKLQKQIQEQKDKYAEAISAEEELKKTVVEREKEVERLEDVCDAKNKEIDGHITVSEEYKNSALELGEKLTEEKDNLTRMQSDYESRVKELEHSNTSLTAEVETTKKQNESLKTDLQKAREKIKSQEKRLGLQMPKSSSDKEVSFEELGKALNLKPGDAVKGLGEAFSPVNSFAYQDAFKGLSDRNKKMMEEVEQLTQPLSEYSKLMSNVLPDFSVMTGKYGQALDAAYNAQKLTFGHINKTASGSDENSDI